MSTVVESETGVLRRMLLGPPLTAPRPCLEELDDELTRHLSGVPDVMRETYGQDTEATREAVDDAQILATLPATPVNVCCKRAMLLFALRREPELQKYFRERDPHLTSDLLKRVLPFIDPEFMRHSCQAPESYAFLAVMLHHMFEGEPLGNWPLKSGKRKAEEQEEQ